MPHNQPSGTRTNGPPSMALPIPPALQSPASLYAGPHPFAPESLLPMARRGSIAGVASLRRPSFASITPSPLSRTQSRDGSVTGSDSDLTAEENGPPGADPAVAGEADSRLVPPSLAIGMAASGQHAKAHTATMADRDTRGRRTSKPGLQPAPPPTTPSNHARPYPQRKSSLPSTPMSPLLGPDPVAPPMLADHLHRQSLHGPAHRLPPLSPTSLAGVATEPFLPPPAPPPLLPAAAAAAAAKGLPASTPGFSPPTQLQQRHQQLQEHQPLAWSSSSPVSPPPPPPQLGGLHRPVLLSHTHSLCLTPVESPTASRNSSYHSVSSAVGRIPVDPILAGVTLSPPSSPSRPRRQASQSAGDVANKSSRSGANKTSSDTIKSGHGLATRQEQQQQPTSKRGRFNWPWSRFVRQPAVHPAHLGASHSEAAIPQLIAPTEYDVNGNSRTPIVIGLTKNSPGSAISVNASMTSSLSDSDDTDESLSLGIQSRQPLGFPFQYPSTLSITSGGGIPQLGFGGGGGYSLGMHPPPRVRHGTSSSSVFKATGGDIQVVPLAPPTISEFRSRTSLFAPLSGGPSSSPTRRPTQISFGFRPPSIMSTGNGNTLGGGGGWGSARPSFTSHYTGTSFSDSMNPLSPKYTSRLTLASSSRPAGLRPTNSFQVGGRTRTASMYFAGARNASLTGSLGFGPSPTSYSPALSASLYDVNYTFDFFGNPIPIPSDMQPQRSPNQEVLRHVPLNLIRGSVIGQLVLHYFMFVVLILTANWMGLSANIRNYSVFLYLNAAMYTMQVFRVLYFLNEKSIVPFYISLVPFAIMCVISREAHMLATALWYVSFFIIYLQTGRPNMQKHLVGYSVGFITVYVACVAFMAWFYRSDCTDLVCGTALSEPISWPHEIVWLIACVVVVFCFMTLERFIKRNALTLLERESYVTNLMQANVELKRELKRMKMDKGADLDAPLTRVIQIIREIRDSGETDHDTNASLDMVIKVLTSNDLFNVDVQKKAQDADVADFLNSLMQKGGGAIADAGQQQRGSVSARSNNVPGSVTAMNNAASLGNAAASKVRALSGAAGYQSTATTAAAGGVGTAGESGGTTAAGLGSGGAGSDAIRAQASTTAPFTFDDCAGKRDSIETLVPKEITHLSPDRIAGIESCLEFLETADFDVIQLNELTHGHPVYFTGMRIFERHKLGAAFDIDPRVMQNFLLAVESGYIGANPYHNAMHAADVTASMNYYLTRDRLYGRVPPDEMFAALVAALIHDLSHPGVNNPFLIKTGDRLAMQYNDQAVLEHYHCAMAFAIMRSSPSFNIMCTLTNEQSKAVRDIVVSLVLATDMAMHFEFITKFKNRIEAFLPTAAGGPVAAPNGATPPPPAAPAATGAAAGTNPHGSQATVPAAVAATTAAAAPSPVQGNVLFGFDMDKRADRKFVLQVAMKCADVNNPSKPLTLCTQWTAFIMEEFFRQGDEERRRGMEISMLMDRYNTDIPKCQVGFIDFVVGPLFDVWGKFMEDDIKPLTTNIASNKQYWKQKMLETVPALPPPAPAPVAAPAAAALDASLDGQLTDPLSSASSEAADP